MRTRAIASAKVKTDKIDAKVLAQLGADFLPEVRAPDEVMRALRRRLAHRSSLVRQRTRLRNQVHAVLARNLIEAPVTDVFGQGGRRWLAELSLPAQEREQVDNNLRLHDALDAEVELVERQLAEQALARPDVRRLMTIPGVGAITALALAAVIGDVTRFPSASPGRLPGPGRAGPPVRREGGPHLARRSGARPRPADRGRACRDPHSRPAARIPRSDRGPARQAGRALCDRAQTGRARVARAQQGEDHRYGAPTITQRSCARSSARPATRPPDQSRRRDQAQGARAPLPRRGRAQLPHYVAQKARGRGAGATSRDATVEAVRAADNARQAPQSPDACSSRSGHPAGGNSRTRRSRDNWLSQRMSIRSRLI
jgi:hypothetical protein